uniref:Uncharacterized protein n=1 Tax=Leersia perrieri TaxID=77586 RepID=A0A0D9WHM4_9ORYZ
MDKIDCYVLPQITGTGRNIFQGGNPLASSLPLLGVQLVLIVAVTRVLYFLLKPLKQPRVVSEIMARPPFSFPQPWHRRDRSTCDERVGLGIFCVCVSGRHHTWAVRAVAARGVQGGGVPGEGGAGAEHGSDVRAHVRDLPYRRSDGPDAGGPVGKERRGDRPIRLPPPAGHDRSGLLRRGNGDGARRVEAVHVPVRARHLALRHVLRRAVADPVGAEPPQLRPRPHRHVGVDDDGRHRVDHHGGVHPRRGVPRVASHIDLGVPVRGRPRRVHTVRGAPRRAPGDRAHAAREARGGDLRVRVPPRRAPRRILQRRHRDQLVPRRADAGPRHPRRAAARHGARGEDRGDGVRADPAALLRHDRAQRRRVADALGKAAARRVPRLGRQARRRHGVVAVPRDPSP